MFQGNPAHQTLQQRRRATAGERTINPVEAEVVRRVFRDFANGVSPQAIALRQNVDGLPGPGGRLWSATTIRGRQKRGTA